MSDAWHPIYSTRGIYRVLEREPGIPATISEQSVEQLRHLARVQSIGETPKGYVEIDPGTRLIITSGAYEGQHVICTYSKADRIRIMMHIFGREVETVVSRSIVALA